MVEPRPGLVPLVASDPEVAELQGLSLKNVRASAYTESGKKINTEFGEMLFTHFGVSGPIILSMSNAIGEHLDKAGSPVRLSLDFKPALEEEKLDRRLQRDLQEYSNRQLKNALHDLLPQRLIPVVIKRLNLDPGQVCHQISRTERLAMMNLLKNFPLTIIATRPIAEAIITVGGINIKDIDPKTMESKLVKGLFFAGEVLDVDGYTGGYNLQAAFSTGYLAGINAAKN
jgi:predicted Rossmann fold flavoprotein